MVIIAHISRNGVRVADAIYRTGLHVDIQVSKPFRHEKIHFPLENSENKELSGTWESALDWYFNEGVFDSKDSLFPGETRRVGNARDHKSLFRQAATALWKDLEPLGYTVEIEFQ